MAERNVAVKLSANVSQYMAAMASAKAATAGMSAGATRNFTQLGGALQGVGRVMSVGVTAPLVALGAGAVAMSAKFDTAFAQMVGLANVPASEVDNLKESVLALAGETAVAPQELAEGLYFAASAGLDSAAAMEALELAARASAAGMGSTKDVVGLVASAVTVYGEANMSAAEATDILAATIREGRAEPAELASTMGRVIPIAEAMGISLGEVGGALAFMTNRGLDTDQAVTGLRDTLMKLNVPGAAAQQALTDMGTSSEELAAAISQDGLVGALNLLREHGFDGNAAALRALMPDMQGYNTLTALLADTTGELAGTIDTVTNSAGSLDTAFAAVSETAGFKMKQAMTDIKVAMIEVGDVLLPIAAQMAESISGMIGWFTDLGPSVQKVVIAFAGLAATAGPAAFVLGSVLKNLTLLTGSRGSAIKLASALGGIGLALTTGLAIYEMFTGASRRAEARTRLAAEALDDATVSAWDYATATEAAGGEVDGLAVAQQALSAALTTGSPEAEALTAALGALGMQASDAFDVFMSFREGPVAALTALAESAGAVGGNAEILATFVDEMNRLGSGPAFFNLVDIFDGNADAAERWVERNQGIIDSLDEVYDQAAQVDLADMATEFLNGAVAASAEGEALVVLAESHAQAGRNGEYSLGVFDAFNEILEDMTPAERDAALAAAGLTEATLESANAALVAEAGYGALTEALSHSATHWADDPTGKWIDGFRTLSDESKGVSTSLNKVGTAADDAAGGVDELATVMASSIDTSSIYQENLADVERVLGAYSDAVGDAMAPHRNLENAIDDVWAAAIGFGEAVNDDEGELDLFTMGIDRSTDAGQENRNLLQSWADDIGEMSQARLREGESVASVTADYEFNRDALLDAAEAAGFNRDQVETMINEYGLVPDLITTSIELAGTALAQWRIDRYLQDLNEIPEVYATAIEAAMDMSDVATAERILRNLTTPRTAWITVYANTWAAQNSMNALSRVTGRQSAEGRFVPGGSNMLTTVAERGGRAGDEVILPLGDPSRMAQLLGLSAVGPRVAAAFGNLTPYSPSLTSASIGSAGDTHVTNNVHVIMPPGADGDDVVRALKKWQRRSGPLPLEVR